MMVLEKAVCPHCGCTQTSEVIYLEPLDERTARRDRRENAAGADVYRGVDRRMNRDRRQPRTEAAPAQQAVRPDTVCLSCDYMWRAS